MAFMTPLANFSSCAACTRERYHIYSTYLYRSARALNNVVVYKLLHKEVLDGKLTLRYGFAA